MIAKNDSTVQIHTNVSCFDIKVTSHDYVVGTADYFALNQYASRLVTLGEIGPDPSYSRDMGIKPYISKDWSVSLTSTWLTVRILI
jgi:hypothetical protein